METNQIKVLLLVGPGASSKAVANTLAKAFNLEAIVLESKPSARRLLSRRAAKVGWVRTIGQGLFIAAARLAAFLSSNRIEELYASFGMETREFPLQPVKVESINDDATLKLVGNSQAQVIVVNGTRIITPSILSAAKVPIINVHMGITPKYRGVHGGYWALARNDPENFGATIHLIDTGIDTGRVLAQVRMSPLPGDNFLLFRVRQLGEAMPKLTEVIVDLAGGERAGLITAGESRLHYHPTVWEYIYRRFRCGVK